MAGNDDTNVELPKANDDNVDYNAPNMSSEWLVNGHNASNASSCPSAPIIDSFCPPIWDQSIDGQSLGYCNNANVQNDPSTSSSVGWMSNAMLRDSMFVPTVSRMSPLPPFPADSAFVERAARLSRFSGGKFSEMVNSFTVADNLNPLSRAIGWIQGLRNETEGSSLNNEKNASLLQAHDEAKNGLDVLNNQSDEAEFSGRGTREESSGKGVGLKKRKRTEKRTENNEAPQPDSDMEKENGDQNPSLTTNVGGDHSKQDLQTSDPPKEGYIHVRARRGQATNSHSLAERIRREKISERMKFLQDLVPGCSKVTGKAVMLDEIINYVQSLQRQVEFLSMKLSTVNPHLDFEGFHAKDTIQSRAGPSSSIAFPPDMSMRFPPLHTPQPGINHSGLRNSSDTSHNMHATRVWEDELHNIIHNGLNSSASINTQNFSGHES